MSRWQGRALGILLVVLLPPAASAVPSFARQLGVQCNACHSAYPQLNAFGRQFKLNGYTLQGADVPFYERFSGMLQPSFTHTEKGVAGGAAPHFGDNDNFALTQASGFYGGRILGSLDHLGAFVQVTYDGVGRAFEWDNTDLRYARATTLGSTPVVLGLDANNNPSVQDPWNALPAWRFPFTGSGLAPTPAASTLLEGGLAGTVAGIGGYVLWNDLVYAELNVYQSLGPGILSALGVRRDDIAEGLDGGAPYWRLALQRGWGSHTLELGTFGLLADAYPGRDRSAGTTDRLLDLGLDLQYQYHSGLHGLTARAAWIHEDQTLDASVPLGLADNRDNHLDSIALSASYLFDLTYGLDLGYDYVGGSDDATLYGTASGSPNSSFFTVQADWLPFNKGGGPSAYPWFNPKLSLQYVLYDKFDGTSDGASDNNTLYLQAWLVF